MRHAIVADSVLVHGGRGGDAVVIEDGRIVTVTDRRRLGELPVEHHPGSTVVPSFIDSHFHPVGYAALVSGVSLKSAVDIDDLVERLGQAAAGAPALMAQRFDDMTLGRMPTRRDLDRAAPDRPLLAYRYCGHVAVANTRALELAGIDSATPDPPGGSLDRGGQGIPTGVLRETAIELVSAAMEPLIPPPTDADILSALSGLAAIGLSRITGIVAAGTPLWCGVGDELETMCRLAPQLPLAVDLLVTANDPDDLRQAAARIADAGGRIRFWGWKAFADGSLGGHTAAMHAPFADSPATGTLRLDPEHAGSMARAALDLAGVAAIHAIGDRAIDATLDVFEALIIRGYDPARMRVEHASVASADAIRRMAATGLVASIQPAFLTSESEWVPARLGPSRSAYRFSSMTADGVVLLGGSDCPVERPDPLVGIAAAVGRQGWNDGQEVDLATALGWFTSQPATHLGLPEPMAPGSAADLVVVEGTLGDPEAKVGAVYRAGVAETVAPVAWPG